MTKVRVCLSIDEDLYKKTRDIQSFLIKETSRNFTFSKVISEILEVGLTNGVDSPSSRRFSDAIKKIVEAKKLE